MEVTLEDKDGAWRRRGRPPREVPAQVAQLAQQTYRTGKCAVVTVEPDEEEEATELMNILTSYARSLGKRCNFQRDGDILRFEMVDRKTTRKATA